MTIKKPRKPRKPGKTTTGKGAGGRPVNADQSGWRVKLAQQRIKFDDDQKDIYLAELAKTGRKLHSAEVANTTRQTVTRHMKNDMDFADKVADAEGQYAEDVQAEVKRRGMDGHLEPLYHGGKRTLNVLVDKDGIAILDADDQIQFIPASVLRHSDRLLELEAKRTNPEYRDKPALDPGALGGVLVAPADMTPTEWVEQQRLKNLERRPPEGVEDKPE